MVDNDLDDNYLEDWLQGNFGKILAKEMAAEIDKEVMEELLGIAIMEMEKDWKKKEAAIRRYMFNGNKNISEAFDAMFDNRRSCGFGVWTYKDGEWKMNTKEQT